LDASVGRIAGLQGSPREGPESAPEPPFRCGRLPFESTRRARTPSLCLSASSLVLRARRRNTCRDFGHVSLPSLRFRPQGADPQFLACCLAELLQRLESRVAFHQFIELRGCFVRRDARRLHVHRRLIRQAVSIAIVPIAVAAIAITAVIGAEAAKEASVTEASTEPSAAEAAMEASSAEAAMEGPAAEAAMEGPAAQAAMEGPAAQAAMEAPPPPPPCAEAGVVATETPRASAANDPAIDLKNNVCMVSSPIAQD
jgi:hypothetical protein